MPLIKLALSVKSSGPFPGWWIQVSVGDPKALVSELRAKVSLDEDETSKIAKALEGIESEHGIGTWTRLDEDRFIHRTPKHQWHDKGFVKIEEINEGDVAFRSYATQKAEDRDYATGLLAGRFIEMIMTHFGNQVGPICSIKVDEPAKK